MIIDRQIKANGRNVPARRYDTTSEMVSDSIGTARRVIEGITQGEDVLVPRSDALLDRIETIDLSVQFY